MPIDAKGRLPDGTSDRDIRELALEPELLSDVRIAAMTSRWASLSSTKPMEGWIGDNPPVPAEINLKGICSFVSRGGSLIEWASHNDVMFHDVYHWLMDDQARRTAYTAAIASREEWYVQRLVTELRAISTLDLAAAVDGDGCLKPLDQIPASVRRAIAGIETDELWEGRGKDREQVGVTKKVKFIDKLRAGEMILKMLGKLNEKHEHTGPGGAPIQVITGVPQPEPDADAPKEPPKPV